MINNSKDRKLRGKWKQLTPGIYESKYGDRVHTGGLIIFANGDIIRLSNFYSYMAVSDYMALAGNKKRGMMLFTEIAKPSEIMAIRAITTTKQRDRL